jgi:hypothetical protein
LIVDNAHIFDQSEEAVFIRDVVSDTDSHPLITYWVSIDVENPEYKGKAVIENGRLFSYFYETQDIHQDEYKKMMYWMLKKKSTLKIKKDDFASYGFRIVPYDTAVAVNAQKGADHFIKTYVKDGFLIYRVFFTDGGVIAEDGLYAVISQLYDFNIKVICNSVTLDLFMMIKKEQYETIPIYMNMYNLFFHKYRYITFISILLILGSIYLVADNYSRRNKNEAMYMYMYKLFFHKYRYITFILLIIGCIYLIVDNAYLFDQGEEAAFIKDVISDTDNIHTPWISINVESPEYNGKAVIENKDLLFYFYKTQGIYQDGEYMSIRDEYKKMVYRLLKKKSTLKIKRENDFASYGFHIVPNDTAVAVNAQKGAEHFIKIYTKENGYLIKDGKVVDEELYAVISQLYDFNIKVIRNCELGFLRIEKEQTE